MTTETESQRLVALIHSAFNRSDPCHCHGDGKLSEHELLASLARRRIVLPRDFVDILAPKGILLDDMAWGKMSYAHFPSTVVHDLRRINITHLEQLPTVTYSDLMALPGVGRVAVDKVERAAALFGVLLKDGAATTPFCHSAEYATPS